MAMSRLISICMSKSPMRNNCRTTFKFGDGQRMVSRSIPSSTTTYAPPTKPGPTCASSRWAIISRNALLSLGKRSLAAQRGRPVLLGTPGRNDRHTAFSRDLFCRRSRSSTALFGRWKSLTAGLSRPGMYRGRSRVDLHPEVGSRLRRWTAALGRCARTYLHLTTPDWHI